MGSSVYIFCIDTDQYAGNFERELCAFMTGMTGECGVGGPEAEAYEKAGFEPMEDLVISMPDDHGCYRPAKIQPTPGWFNDGVGSHYRLSDYDPEEVLKKHNKSVEDYAKNTIEKVYADKIYAKKEADRHRKEQTLKKFTKKNMHPAYMSVGIFLSRKPTKEEVERLKERAALYAKKPLGRFATKFKIDGFRLVTRKTSDEGQAI